MAATLVMHSHFHRGDRVQRCNHKDGSPPAYRFPGVICGEYVNGMARGYVVSREGDRGCLQTFPEHMIELIQQE